MVYSCFTHMMYFYHPLDTNGYQRLSYWYLTIVFL